MIWPTKKLGEVLDRNGVIPAKIKRDEYHESGKYPVVDQGENLIAGYIDDEQKLYRGDLPVIIFGDHTRILKYIDFPFAFGADGIKILRPQEILLPKFFYYTLILNPVANQGYKRHFSLLVQTKIPLPPLATQKQIVERLDKIAEAQKLNDELIQKTEELYRSLLHNELNVKIKNQKSKIQFKIEKLKDVAEIIMGQSPPSSTYNEMGEGLPFFQGKAEFGEIYPTPTKYCPKPTRIAEVGDILMSVRAPVGNINLAKERSGIGRGLGVIRARKGIDQSFLYFFFIKNESNWSQLSVGSTFLAIRRNNLDNLEVPIPPLEIQKQIVARLSAVQDYKKQLLEQKSKLKELFDSALYKSMSQR